MKRRSFFRLLRFETALAFREENDLLGLLRLVVFEREGGDGSTLAVGRMDRFRFMAQVVHGLALRHPRRTRPLRPGITVGMQPPTLDFQRAATAAKFRRAMFRQFEPDFGKEKSSCGS